MAGRLAGKTAVVVGAGQTPGETIGNGRAMAVLFAREGAQVLVVDRAGDRAEDDGSAFLLHPALERFYPPSRRIVIPERLTVCGGVMLADALDVLVKELERVAQR